MPERDFNRGREPENAVSVVLEPKNWDIVHEIESGRREVVLSPINRFPDDKH